MDGKTGEVLTINAHNDVGAVFIQPRAFSRDIKGIEMFAHGCFLQSSFSCFTNQACTRSCFPRRSEEHTSELQSRGHLVCRLLLEKKNSTLDYSSELSIL